MKNWNCAVGVAVLGVCTWASRAAAKETSSELAISDPTRLTFDGVPTYVLLASQSITTLDVSAPTVNFGIQRNGPRLAMRVMLRKNIVDGNVSGEAGSAELGKAILAPSLANLGIGIRPEWRLISWVADTSNIKKNQDVNAYCNQSSRPCHTLHGPFLYGDIDVASATFNATKSDASNDDDSKSTTTASVAVVPLRLSLGAGWRVHGNLPVSLINSTIYGFSPYVGGTMRIIGGNLTATERKDFFSNPSQVYAGLEIGANIQFGGLLIEPIITSLWPTEDKDTQALSLSGLQFLTTFTFQVPWSVTGNQSGG